jgi:predicted phage tail protein
MVRALLVLVGALRSAWLIELVGAALIVWAIWMAWGDAAAVGAAGVALVLKAFELDGAGS